MSETAQDGLGYMIQQQFYDAATTTAHITSYTHTQYNAIGNPTSVQKVDLTPQTGQTITSVTATATYDDAGRMTSSTDPDRGNHIFTYDADGHVLTDVSSTRTLGMSYDQLGRVGCIQDATPTTNGYGGCSSTAHPLMQYAYDVTTLGTSGSSDFSIGQMTRSVATTYYPDGTAATTTQQMQHDQRGRITSATMQLGVPSSWNVTTALPTYQENLSYNDANQLTTTQTTVGGQAGYTFTQAYNSTTGQLTGLSNNSTGVANLATLGYDTHGNVSDVNFQTTTGTALANDHFAYDGNLRPASASATWQSGSGSSGTIFSQSRSYDPLGNVVSLSTTLAAVPGQSGSGGSETQNFCYDEQDRLVWAGNSGTQPAPGNGTCGSGTLSSGLSGAGYSTSYAYTHLGQLWQGPLNGTGSYQYLYCNSSHPHQLIGLYPTGTTCGNLTGAVYTSSNDAWGNVTNRTYNGTNATLSYNALDELVQWNAGASSQEWYAYDLGGNRTLRRSTTGSGTSITVYAFGLEEHLYSSSGTPQSSTYSYTVAGRPLGALQGSTTQFFLTDALGSIITTFSTTAGSAVVQGNQLYGPYGTNRYSKGSMGTSKGFTGQYADTTGLDYYNARYYDPVVGQFLSVDTVQGNMQGMNPYGYVAGNPETLTDPTGKRFIGGGSGGGEFPDLSQITQNLVYTPPPKPVDLGSILNDALITKVASSGFKALMNTMLGNVPKALAATAGTVSLKLPIFDSDDFWAALLNQKPTSKGPFQQWLRGGKMLDVWEAVDTLLGHLGNLAAGAYSFVDLMANIDSSHPDTNGIGADATTLLSLTAYYIASALKKHEQLKELLLQASIFLGILSAAFTLQSIMPITPPDSGSPNNDGSNDDHRNKGGGGFGGGLPPSASAFIPAMLLQPQPDIYGRQDGFHMNMGGVMFSSIAF